MNVYGPRMDHLGAYTSVLANTLRRVSAAERPIIYGDGSQTYDFIYVEDVARANLLAMNCDASIAFVNIGSGVGTSVTELVRQVCQISGVPFAPEFQPDRAAAVKTRIGSTALARGLLQFHATVALEAGLRSTIEWWRREVSASLDR